MKKIKLFFISFLFILFSCDSDDSVAMASVSLNKDALSLEVGKKSIVLTTTFTPKDATNKKVSWSSDKSTIATVDANGVVTAVAVGTAKITVTTDDGLKTDTVNVTVTPILVKSVSLNKDTLSLEVGATTTVLTATVLPENATNKEVSWASDKPTIATVDANGVVTAVAVGTAKITVTTKDGLKTDTVNVAVTPILVTSVSLNKDTLSLEVGDKTTVLTATVLLENATNKEVSWASDKPTIATVDANGVVTAVAVGTAKITVTTKDGGKTATVTVTVTATEQETATEETATEETATEETATEETATEETATEETATEETATEETATEETATEETATEETATEETATEETATEETATEETATEETATEETATEETATEETATEETATEETATEETATEETATEETATEETATEETATQEEVTPIQEEVTPIQEEVTPIQEEVTPIQEEVTPVTPLAITLAGGAPTPDDVTLVHGYTVKLKANNASNVRWSSSNTVALSVTQEGVVKAEASSGSAVITATDRSNNSRTATINFTVQGISGTGYDGNSGFTFADEIPNTVRALTTKRGTTNINYGDLSQDTPADVVGYVLTTGDNNKLVVSKSANSFKINTITYEWGDAVAVWIDWNIDGYFYGDSSTSHPVGSNEYYLITEGVASTGGAHIEITIPNIARVGTLRMRVQCVWGPNTSAKFFANTPAAVGESSVRDFEVEITE